MDTDQKGFSVIELLFLVVILGVLGVTGWYVYHATQGASSTYATTNTNKPPATILATLSGIVTEGPNSPVAKASDSGTEVVVSNHVIQAQNAQGKVVAVTKTDALGKYTFRIHPGQYTLVLVPQIGMGVIKSNTIDVVSGANTLNLVADTGIR